MNKGNIDAEMTLKYKNNSLINLNILSYLVFTLDYKNDLIRKEYMNYNINMLMSYNC